VKPGKDVTLNLTDIATAESLELFNRDAPIAHGLPALAYTNKDYWNLENDKLFNNTWVFAGFAHEIPNPGDALPFTVSSKPVFLIRNKDRQIKAFHNACRHRGLKLVDTAGNVGPRLRCPYHSWVYGLNGDLRSTPYFGGPDQHTPEGFDNKEHGLLPVNCAVWHDWIFVNLSLNPDDFEPYVAPLANRLSGLDLDGIIPVASLEFGEVRCNWKLLMENFIEPYHVQFVHSSTTDQPLKDHYTVIDGRCLGSAVELSKAVDKNTNTLAVDSLYLTLFPNFVFGHYAPDQIGVHLNLPIDVDHTVQKRVIYITDDRERSQDEIENLKELWHKVHKEDHAICERVQQGKASAAAADGGRLSPHWENSVRSFQKLALDAVR
jgi:choline monooxygenase